MNKKNKKIKIFSALEAANICGVVNQTAINWIKNGSLKAFVTPGGQYRIYTEDLVKFLKERKMRIPPELSGDLSDPLKILIIDSDKNSAEIIRKRLEEAFPGCLIFAAACGFDAGRFMSEKPEIIIFVEPFPDLAAEDLCKIVESESEGKKPAVIYVADTALAQEQNLKTDITLRRPIDFGKIFEFIRSYRKESPGN